MDFYQARLGFGTTKEGVTAWKELKTETVALAMKKGGPDAAKKVEKAFLKQKKLSQK